MCLYRLNNGKLFLFVTHTLLSFDVNNEARKKRSKEFSNKSKKRESDWNVGFFYATNDNDNNDDYDDDDEEDEQLIYKIRCKFYEMYPNHKNDYIKFSDRNKSNFPIKQCFFSYFLYNDSVKYNYHSSYTLLHLISLHSSIVEFINLATKKEKTESFLSLSLWL